MAIVKDYDGDAMRHREQAEWHVTRSVEIRPGGHRIFRMYCGQEIPQLAAVLGVLRPLNVTSENATTLPACSDCCWLLLARYKERLAASNAG